MKVKSITKIELEKEAFQGKLVPSLINFHGLGHAKART